MKPRGAPETHDKDGQPPGLSPNHHRMNTTDALTGQVHAALALQCRMHVVVCSAFGILGYTVKHVQR